MFYSQSLKFIICCDFLRNNFYFRNCKFQISKMSHQDNTAKLDDNENQIQLHVCVDSGCAYCKSNTARNNDSLVAPTV